MAEEDDIMLAWARVNTASALMRLISEAADDIQYGFRLHGTISAHQYKMARNYIIISNIQRQRGDFIRNPRRAPYDAAPTVVVGTVNMFNRSLRRYGVNGFVVRFPNWVLPIEALRIRQAAAATAADVDVLEGVLN